MPPKALVDISGLDFNEPVADLERIRRVNRQRYEMEQLTAVVAINTLEHTLVGYKDVRRDEFWVRGHVAGFPLMPGVLMCEAAAQLCSYYVATQQLLGGDFVAFGGMDRVKFRGMVRPGDRLVLAARAKELRVGRIAVFSCQGIVDQAVVFEAELIGVPFYTRADRPPTRMASIRTTVDMPTY